MDKDKDKDKEKILSLVTETSDKNETVLFTKVASEAKRISKFARLFYTGFRKEGFSTDEALELTRDIVGRLL